MLPEIMVVTRTQEPVAPADLEELERTLGTALPDGYDALLTSYGQGTFCDELNLWGPERVLTSLQSSREAWEEFWFWDEEAVSKAEMRSAVPLGDSANGDQLALVPDKGLVFLPRDEEEVHSVGPSCLDALTWFLTSGTLVEPRGVLWFASWVEQHCYENWAEGTFDAAREAVTGRHRHAVEDLASDGRSTTFLVPAMGGHLYLAERDDPSGVYAHLRYLPDLVETADDLAKALESAGVRRQSRWGAEPAG